MVHLLPSNIKIRILPLRKQRWLSLVEDSLAVCPGSDGEVVYGDPVDEIVGFAEAKKLIWLSSVPMMPKDWKRFCLEMWRSMC